MSQRGYMGRGSGGGSSWVSMELEFSAVVRFVLVQGPLVVVMGQSSLPSAGVSWVEGFE